MSARPNVFASPPARIAALAVAAMVALAVVLAAQFVARERELADLGRLRDAAEAAAVHGAAMQRAESALRGYLVSGQTPNVAAFEAAVEQAESARARLERALPGTPAFATAAADLARAATAAGAEWRSLAIGRAGAAESASASPLESRLARYDAVQATLTERLGAAAGESSMRASQLRAAMIATGVLLALATATALAALFAWARREQNAHADAIARVARESQHDPHTRLPNRRFFLEWVGYALAGCQRDGDGLGLVMATVHAGDVRLRADALAAEIAKRLRALKRDSDCLGVIDDHVFAIAALHVQDAQQLAPLAQRVLRALSDPPLPGAKLAPLTIAVGAARFPDDADDLPGLLAAADSALSAARRAGRSCVVFHGAPSPDATPLDR